MYFEQQIRDILLNLRPKWHQMKHKAYFNNMSDLTNAHFRHGRIHSHLYFAAKATFLKSTHLFS